MVYSLPVIKEAISFTYREAEISSESKIWTDAMMEEMTSLHKNDIWLLSELPKGKKVIDCKWVFVKKLGSSEGDTVCYIARLVDKGYVQ